MDVTGRVAVANPADPRGFAGFDGIGMCSGVGISSIPPHTRNRIAPTVENERVPASQDPRDGLLACSDGSGLLSASFNNRCRGSGRSAPPLNIPGFDVPNGSRLPPAPLA